MCVTQHYQLDCFGSVRNESKRSAGCGKDASPQATHWLAPLSLRASVATRGNPVNKTCPPSADTFTLSLYHFVTCPLKKTPKRALVLFLFAFNQFVNQLFTDFQLMRQILT